MTAHEFTLPTGKVILMKELGLAQMRLVLKKDAGFDQTLHGLRLSIVEIDGDSVNHDKMAQDKIGEYLSMKEISTAAALWESLHAPTDEEVAASKNSGKAKVGGT